jgi:hypothetical protein
MERKTGDQTSFVVEGTCLGKLALSLLQEWQHHLLFRMLPFLFCTEILVSQKPPALSVFLSEDLVAETWAFSLLVSSAYFSAVLGAFLRTGHCNAGTTQAAFVRQTWPCRY